MYSAPESLSSKSTCQDAAANINSEGYLHARCRLNYVSNSQMSWDDLIISCPLHHENQGLVVADCFKPECYEFSTYCGPDLWWGQGYWIQFKLCAVQRCWHSKNRGRESRWCTAKSPARSYLILEFGQSLANKEEACTARYRFGAVKRFHGEFSN